MKRLFCLLLGLMLLVSSAASAELTPDPLVESALTLLPADDPFLARYNALTGAEVTAQFPQGVPYLFGGKKDSLVYSRYPDYNSVEGWQDSDYYRKGLFYFGGFDCGGFITHVRQENGLSALPGLSGLLYEYLNYGKSYVYTSNSHCPNPMLPTAELKDTLAPGDLLVVHHGSYHVMMYIGTLRDFGFTEAEAPALADYLDYPLVIHCGGSPVYGARFQQMIDEQPGCAHMTTTDGGVQVSIFGVPRAAADVHEHVQQTDYDYFLLAGDWPMTIVDMTGVTSWCWIRLAE